MTEAQNHATEIGREARRRRLRHRRRLRRRRHAERGRERARRHRRPGLGAARAARPTSSPARSGSPTTSSTPPSTCSGSPTTSSRARSTSGSPTAAASSSPAAPGSTPPRRSGSTAHPQLKVEHRPLLLHLGRDLGLLPPVPAQPGADACRGGRAARPRASPRSSRTPTRSPTSATTPVRCRGTSRLDDGTLVIAVAAPRRPARHAVHHRPGAGRAPRRRPQPPPDRRLRGTSPRRGSSRSRATPRGRSARFPVQVDGDYIGDHGELDIAIEPGALTVVA